MRLTFIALLVLLQTQPSDSAAQPEPLRLSATIGGERAVVEVRDLPADQAMPAAKAALEEIAIVHRTLTIDNQESPIARINEQAGKGVEEIDGETGTLLHKAIGYCVWTRGAQGPLGGALYDLWETSRLPPRGEKLDEAVLTAACRSLILDPETQRAALAGGSRIDLRHFIAGYAIDQATHSLQEAGARNTWIEFAGIMRASGGGPQGDGWKVTLPLFPGQTEAFDPIRLRNSALAVVGSHDQRFDFDSGSYAAFLDQRSGRPPSGVLGVLAVSELAIDAQGIATSMMILGNREGMLRLGTTDPSPSVLWLMGDGSGEPLLTTYKWSVLTLQ
jgi:thiamine biosynthesis lipoprotein